MAWQQMLVLISIALAQQICFARVEAGYDQSDNQGRHAGTVVTAIEAC